MFCAVGDLMMRPKRGRKIMVDINLIKGDRMLFNVIIIIVYT